MLFRLLAEAIGELLLQLFDEVPAISFTVPWSEQVITFPGWFPVNIFLGVLSVAIGVNAYILVLVVTDWIYRHIPQVFGTGPGAG